MDASRKTFWCCATPHDRKPDPRRARGRRGADKCYYHEGDLDSITAQERMALFKLFIDPEDRIALRWLLGFGSNDFRAGAYRRLRINVSRRVSRHGN